jgi:hypothetical protein
VCVCVRVRERLGTLILCIFVSQVPHSEVSAKPGDHKVSVCVYMEVLIIVSVSVHVSIYDTESVYKKK